MKRNHILILSDFMEGLNTMIDASGQMVHQFGNIKWMAVRDILNVIRDSKLAAVNKSVVHKGPCNE